MLCPKCGQETADGSKFCGACGGAIESEKTFAEIQQQEEVSDKQTHKATKKFKAGDFLAVLVARVIVLVIFGFITEFIIGCMPLGSMLRAYTVKLVDIIILILEAGIAWGQSIHADFVVGWIILLQAISGWLNHIKIIACLIGIATVWCAFKQWKAADD